VTRVQFALTGGTDNQLIIGTAVASYYGYIAPRNSTMAPDGTYTLQCLVTDSLGNTVYSPGITVSVDNAPPTTACRRRRPQVLG
jgi:hypothetical protein